MSAKKPAARAKEKISKCAAVAATAGMTKRSKPAAGTKQLTQVMDARSNKDRRENDRRKNYAPVEVNHRSTERRVKVNRRRQIDPTTCERDYSPEEIEFMGALDEYKRRSGRMFPTCSEILEVFKALGYEKRAELPTVALPAVPVVVSLVTTDQAV
ncbi:MAG: hypothetical protein ABSG53_09315 [Thermoguttaceae bacterium]